jgi:hypothetical protein
MNGYLSKKSNNSENNMVNKLLQIYTAGTSLESLFCYAKIYEFPHSVSEALKITCYEEIRILEPEDEWMKTDTLCISKQRIGFTYAAINPCMKIENDAEDIIKIGATMKDTPQARLKELSRSVPQDYILVACIASPDPFAVEKLCHGHFASKRIWRLSTGRRTEFFKVERKDVEDYFAIINREFLASTSFVDDSL